MKRRYFVRHRIHSQYVTSAESYAEVAALWDRAYRASGKIAPVTSYAETQALGDARIIGFYEGTEIVACFVIRFPDEQARLTSVDVPLGHYPSSFPPKADSIEISKLCIDQRYRGTDLIKSLFEQVHRELVLAGRASILICCERRLIKLYEMIGFSRTGHFFEKKSVPGGELHILVSTQKRFGIYGLHVGPVRWNLFLGAITRTMRANGEIAPPFKARAAWRAYSLFRPVASALEHRRARALERKAS